jgi:RHS repeat-associated protein
VTSAIGTTGFCFRDENISRRLVYDYRNRFYHPDLGRFLQIDPTGFDAGDMNLFRYCNDGPIDGSDPTGLYDVGFEGYGKPPTSSGHATKDTMGNVALRAAMEARGGRSFGRELGGSERPLRKSGEC